MRPEPTKVWMLEEGDSTTTEGTLSIEEEVLTFDPVAGTKLQIPRTTIQKARRARSSPVLMVTLREEHTGERSSLEEWRKPTSGRKTSGILPRKLFFYFAKPPPLPGERPTVPMPIFRAPKGLEKSAAALSLRTSNRLLKREIETWVRALREAVAGS
ncbi:MAG: hypothetical protein ACRDH9_08230 [Actinomycetota bacterium]